MNYKLTFIIFLSLIFISCIKDDPLENVDVIKVSIKNTETYTYATGISGDEEGAIIRKQASYYETSKLIRDESTNWEVVYIYKPHPSFIGTDEVEIVTYQGSDGASPNDKEGVIKIIFEVTD